MKPNKIETTMPPGLGTLEGGEAGGGGKIRPTPTVKKQPQVGEITNTKMID